MFSIKVQFEIITQDSRSGKRCRVQAGMLKFQSINTHSGFKETHKSLYCSRAMTAR